jgi:hypothetical protein
LFVIDYNSRKEIEKFIKDYSGIGPCFFLNIYCFKKIIERNTLATVCLRTDPFTGAIILYNISLFLIGLFSHVPCFCESSVRIPIGGLIFF